MQKAPSSIVHTEPVPKFVHLFYLAYGVLYGLYIEGIVQIA